MATWSRTVAVIGGGISGLAAAWEVSRVDGDVSVTLLEGSDRLGGKLRLEEVGGIRIDVGAESVLARRPEALTLFEQLGVDGLVTHPGPAGAAIVSRGQPVADAAAAPSWGCPPTPTRCAAS